MMRARLYRWQPGDPPAIILEAETPDDMVVLDAINHNHGRRIMIGGATWESGVGCRSMVLGWAKREDAPNGG